MTRIVIVGGGFSGAVTAVQLARLSREPLDITVLDKSGDFCRGVAYSARRDCLLLNVPAAKMSALADEPDNFVEWLKTRSGYRGAPTETLRELFAPRRVYGDYLTSLFQSHVKSAASRGVCLRLLKSEATQIVDVGNEFRVMAEGKALPADKIVLAIGNLPAAALALPGLAANHPRCINQPWSQIEERLPCPDSDILLVGTGLTMIDTFLVLQELNWRGKIFAVSPHGLLPLSHFKSADYPDFPRGLLAQMSLRQVFRMLHEHYRKAQRAGVHPAVLVDKLRPFSQRIWRNFSTREKRQFLRHLQSLWNTTRHRVAPEIHCQLSEAIKSGKLEIIKGKLLRCSDEQTGLRVKLNANSKSSELTVGAAVNCTRPRQDYPEAGLPLLDDLQSRGLVRQDGLGVGIEVSASFSVISGDGFPSTSLYAIGPILKGELWETTSVPELRTQARRIAEVIADDANY